MIRNLKTKTQSGFNSAGKHLIDMFFITSHNVRRITIKQNKKGAGRQGGGGRTALEHPYSDMPIAMSYTTQIVWVMIFSSTSTVEAYSQMRINYLLGELLP